ncbi:MAG TPA: 2-dehydropantoate 2-reductase [Burkholderiaceae bacterium]|jgi:2-dehydropantoate 2-reductase|nr:2-dehydropantoate 2-reductase [Burkholderiaceae bacterium]
MRVCVVGAGSIGASVGAKLAAAGEQVCLVARGEHLDAIRRGGLQLEDRVGPRSGTYRLPASSDPSDFGPQDLIVIALKAHAVASMLPRLAPLLDSGTVVLPALNGLPWWYFHRAGGPYEGTRLRSLDRDGTMDRALDPARVVGCVVHLAAEVVQPGRVQHTAGRRLIVGEPDGSDSDRLRRIASALQAAGFDCEVTDQIRLAIWTKLIGNMSFNPVATLTGYRMDQICADAQVLEVIRAGLREGIAVAARLGITIGMTVEQRIDVARQLGAARISMLQDLEQRRPLELAAIVGAVIELAELTGVAVPATRTLHALVHARAAALGIAA